MNLEDLDALEAEVATVLATYTQYDTPEVRSDLSDLREKYLHSLILEYKDFLTQYARQTRQISHDDEDSIRSIVYNIIYGREELTASKFSAVLAIAWPTAMVEDLPDVDWTRARKLGLVAPPLPYFLIEKMDLNPYVFRPHN